MKFDFASAMRRATVSTRLGRLTEATRMIRDALSASRSAGSGPAASCPADTEFRAVATQPQLPGPGTAGADAAIKPSAAPQAEATAPPEAAAPRPPRLRQPLGEVLRVLRGLRLPTPALTPGSRSGALASARHVVEPAEGAQFLQRSFLCAAGGRTYKLYIPACAPTGVRGLLVMLHGCKQNPDDFAAGTDMNALAETHGLLVAYPGQSAAANATSCWNWFNPADQKRDAGEPAIIAGITRDLMAEFALHREQVFVAGLSAGGAMAAVMGETYPDVYAAVGVHSGVDVGAANDVMSAFAAMRGKAGAAIAARRAVRQQDALFVRTIVVQGSADLTVHPANAEHLLASAMTRGLSPASRSDSTVVSGGRACTHSLVTDASGATLAECWLVQGTGHAWSGGKPAGSYTDPAGPNASGEMVRFFLGRQ